MRENTMMSPEFLNWVEGAALENLRGRLSTADTLAKEAATTLTIFVAALGSAFAYAISGAALAVPAGVLTAYLFALCVLLVWRCMLLTVIPAITNEPRNLLQDGFGLEQMRRAELQNFQARIDEAVKRNERMAWWLNRLRLAAVAAPLLFLAAVWAPAVVRLVG